MAIRQLSVFLENKKGTLHEITDVLAKADIDLRSMCIADTSDYGIVRIIANDPERAKEVLSKAGHIANVREVTAFAVPDCPGGLAKVLNILEENSVDIAFLDINMRGIGGLGLAEKLIELQPQCKIVFCTGYEKYAVSAFPNPGSVLRLLIFAIQQYP